tara:strand:- start:165 stop:560 length:396 start_codon:yes stop_codon:yes gene_type:complete
MSYGPGFNKYLAALRSGCYEQGTQKLRTTEYLQPDSFCALGVAVDVYLDDMAEDAEVAWMEFIDDQLPSRGVRDYVFGDEGLYVDVTEAIPSGSRCFRKVRVGTWLISELNDTFGASFELIADLLEQQNQE